MKRALLKHTTDVLEKMAVAGMALGLFQANTTGIVWGIIFLAASYICRILEVKS